MSSIRKIIQSLPFEKWLYEFFIVYIEGRTIHDFQVSCILYSLTATLLQKYIRSELSPPVHQIHGRLWGLYKIQYSGLINKLEFFNIRTLNYNSFQVKSMMIIENFDCKIYDNSLEFLNIVKSMTIVKISIVKSMSISFY